MREEGRGNREQGTGKVKLWLALAAIAVGAVIAVLLLTRQDAASTVDARDAAAAEESGAAVESKEEAVAEETAERSETVEGRDSAEENESEESEPEEPLTEDEKREAEEEKRVNDFDDLTDKWQEPSAKGVTMADIDNFAASFRKIPKARRDECIHRALNLIPDENVMLLAGVLMDKSMDKEIVETVFNDVLNRDEDVKKPILQQIFKDKSHPCWADTAWILDVTGELPAPLARGTAI